MNKTEFIKAVAEKAGFTNKDAAIAYDAFVATVTEALLSVYVTSPEVASVTTILPL